MTLSIFRRCGAVLAIAVAAMFPAQVLAQQTITLLHVSDTHSHLAAWGPKDANLDGTLGGLPKVAAIVATQRATDPGLLFVHAGDFMDGDLFFNEYHGVPELQLLKSIGLDAIALGNHEFAYGPSFLEAVLRDAWPGGYATNVPVLGTNVACSPIADWNAGTVIKNVNGVKVGLFGLTTRSRLFVGPSPCTIQPLVAAAQVAVASLKASGAQLIVALSHAGMTEARALAAGAPGIDVIVNGHDNALLDQPEEVVDPTDGHVTRIVSAGSHYEWVGKLRLNWSGTNVNFVDFALIPVDAAVPPDPAMQAAIDALKVNVVAHYGDVYHDPLGWADKWIAPEWDERHAKRDTPLGNLFADAYRAWTGTDVAIEAMGYLDDALPPGWIVGADVFRSMYLGPKFDFTTSRYVGIPQPWRLVTFQASGEALIGALNATIGIGANYFPQVSGIRLNFDSRLPVRDQVLLDTVHVGGHKLVLNKLYSVTVTEGVYAGLASLGMKMQQVTALADSAFTAARALVEERGVIGGSGSNRLRDIAAIGNGNAD